MKNVPKQPQNEGKKYNFSVPKKELLSVYDLPASFANLNFTKFENSNIPANENKVTLLTKNSDLTISIVASKRIFESDSKKHILYGNDYDEERIRNMHPEDRPTTSPKLSLYQQLTLKKWVILLCHGGYFSGGVFFQKKPIAHKTFHHYVTRKKQGGRQSNKDKSKKPKSGGASLRRYNEEKHELEVRKLMKDWKNNLLDADLIFIHLPGANKYQFLQPEEKFDPKSVDFYLTKEDPRIRKIPFTTSRPSYTEVKRVFSILSSVEVTVTLDPEVDDEALDRNLEHINIRSSTEFVERNEDLDDEEEDNDNDNDNENDDDLSGEEKRSSEEE